MATPNLIPSLAGNWTGTSRLNMGSHDPTPIKECASTMTVVDALNFGLITYTWVEDGPQEGALVLIGDDRSDALEIAWVDSWHQSKSVLHLKGSGLEGSKLAASGEYGPYEGQMWGWRIEISQPVESQLLFMMFNVAPDGNEEWAVECLYSRVV